MTTFGTMRARIAGELGDPDDARWTDEIEQAIVDAIKHFQARKFWFVDDKYVQSADVTSVTVAGTEYYAFPTSPVLVVLESLRITNNAGDPYPLERISWEDAEAQAVPYASSSGNPDRYALRGERVRLLQIPNAVFTLYWSGLFKPTTVLTISSDDADTNAWMTVGDELIRNYAKMTVARDTLRDFATAGLALAAVKLADESLTAENLKRKKGRIRAWGA